MYASLFFFSILGRIIRVTDEVIEYRKWIQETFPVESSEPRYSEYPTALHSQSPTALHSQSPTALHSPSFSSHPNIEEHMAAM